MRPGVTPVPIPNTKVKTRTADDTALETVWESRRLPDHKKEKRKEEKSGGLRAAAGTVLPVIRDLEVPWHPWKEEGSRHLMADKAA